MSFDPNVDTCDYVRLANQKSPGLAEVIGADDPRKWEEIEGFGYSGSRLRYRGIGIQNFQVKIRLTSSQDWADWYVWRPLVKRPPDMKRAKAMDIWHPWLEDLGIKSVVVENRTQPVQDEDGVYAIMINFKGFRPLKFALASPEAAAATPVDPVDTLIEDLTGQVQTLLKAP